MSNDNNDDTTEPRPLSDYVDHDPAEWAAMTGRPSPVETFPFPTPREFQMDALEEASNALWRDGYDTVLLRLPTGVGKSGINVALARQARDAFYTTPQKTLRNQLENDLKLSPYYEVLRARSDYICPVGGRSNCSDCWVNNDDEASCMDQRDPTCTYWDHKERAMGSDIATITFTMLNHDSKIPAWVERQVLGEPIGTTEVVQASFTDRELVIIDEAHSLEGQAAGMWVGFTVSPTGKVPASVYYDTFDVDELLTLAKHGDVWRYHQVGAKLSRFAKHAAEHANRLEVEMPTPEEIQLANDTKQQEKLLDERKRAVLEIAGCRSVVSKIEHANGEEYSDDYDAPWTVDLKLREHDDEQVVAIEAKPVYVAKYLKEVLWDRMDKHVLSSATLPFPNNPTRWAKQIGLDPKTVYTVDYPTPFEPENRLVDSGTAIRKLSGDAFEQNIGEVADKIRELANRHDGEKGLVHTVSFERANMLYDHLHDIAVLHDKYERDVLGRQDDQGFIDRWQQGDKDVFLSPSMDEGADLKDDMCRWQVIAKAPYPPQDPREKYLLYEADDYGWPWYSDQTAITIVQMAGRGVRHKDDYCRTYVLDKAFRNIVPRYTPAWFNEAVVGL